MFSSFSLNKKFYFSAFSLANWLGGFKASHVAVMFVNSCFVVPIIIPKIIRKQRDMTKTDTLARILSLLIIFLRKVNKKMTKKMDM